MKLSFDGRLRLVCTGGRGSARLWSDKWFGNSAWPVLKPAVRDSQTGWPATLAQIDVLRGPDPEAESSGSA